MTIRVKYSKEEPLCFISHLDITRLILRASRRAGIPLSISEGFTPHERISFGFPLPLGFVSNSEYADFELNQKISSSQFKKGLAKVLPSGIKILKVEEVPHKKNSLFSSTRGFSYCISQLSSFSQRRIDSYLKREKVFIPGYSFNIRPWIKDIFVDKSGLHLLLEVIGGRTIKVRKILSSLCGLEERDILLLKIKREKTLLEEG